jgi:hypothetical protein
MRCFNHHDVDAVGTCRACGRGLCPNCVAEVEKAVACRNRCESDVATILAINRNSLQYARGTKQAHYLAPLMIIILGGVMAALGLTYRGFDLAILGGGVAMVLGAALAVVQYRIAKGLKA